ncbi:OST-HTH/LOTUS domain-containing protein, partial [Candidatus Fermentibacterales bacterium]|nr:OST-HTH/LOTUS domain-containing protein [Candidatus Fermentibacterales bacterium]
EFDPRNYGYARLSGLVSAMRLFEIDERTHDGGRSKTVYVRDIRKKPTSK